MTWRVSWTVLVCVLAATGCELTPYPNRHVICDPTGRACPDRQRCVDTNDGKGFRCTDIHCGDGIVDIEVEDGDKEECDDANNNERDLCAKCREVVYTPAEELLGSGPGGSKARETPLGRPVTLAADLDGRIVVVSVGTNIVTQLLPYIDNGDAAYLVAPLGGSGTMLSGGAVAKDDRPNEISTTFVASIGIDTFGNVFLADFQDSVIRRVDAVTGLVDTIVGTGIAQTTNDDGAGGTLGLATDVSLPDSINIDEDGSVFFIERGPAGQSGDQIRRFDRTTETVSTVDRTVDTTDDTTTDPTGRPLDDIALDNRGHLFTFERSFTETRGCNRCNADEICELSVCVEVCATSVDCRGGVPCVDARCRSDFSVITRYTLSVDENGSVKATARVDTPLPRAFVAGDIEAVPQRRFATADGERFFFLVDSTVVMVEDLAAPVRTVIATVPTPVSGDDGVDIVGLSRGDAATTLFSLTPTDLVLVDDWVLVADPGNGVVWRFSQSERDVVADAQHVLAGVFVGAEPVEDVMNEIVLGFARETDGRMGIGLSDDCGADPIGDPFSGPTLEFSLAFPELHRVVFSTCESFVSVVAGSGERGRQDAVDLPIDETTTRAKEFKLTRPTALVRIESTPTNGITDDALFIADRDRGVILQLLCNDPATQREKLCGEAGFVIRNFMSEALGLPLRQPSGLAVDDRYGLLIADTGNHRILRHDVITKQTSVVFGTGVAGDNGDDGTATTTQLNEPTSLVYVPLSLVGSLAEVPFQLSGGLLLVTEQAGHRVRAAFLPPLPGFPQVMTLAGDGSPGDDDDVDDGRNGRLRSPRSVMFSFPDAQTQQLRFLVIDAVDRIREVGVSVNLNPANVGLTSSLTTIEGAGQVSRDDGAFADAAVFRAPTAMAFLDADRFLVVDRAKGRLRLTSLVSKSVVTVAGTPDGDEPRGERAIPALTSAPLREPTDLAIQLDVEPPVVWIADDRPGELRRFHLTDVDDPTTWTTDVVPVPELLRPTGLAVEAGVLFVSDREAHTVYRLDLATLSASVVAGRPGTRGDAGDADAAFRDAAADDETAPDSEVRGLAREALLNEPSGLAVRGDTLLIADTGNSRVRMVTGLSSSEATITSFLGDGDRASGGEGAPAAAFPVLDPRGIDIDDNGNVVVAATNVVRFVEASRTALAQPTDQVGTIYGKAPRDSFPASATRCIDDVVFAPLPPEAKPEDRPLVYAVDSCTGLIVPLSGAAVPAGVPPEAAR